MHFHNTFFCTIHTKFIKFSFTCDINWFYINLHVRITVKRELITEILEYLPGYLTPCHGILLNLTVNTDRQNIPLVLWAHFYRTSHSGTGILRKPEYMSTKLRGPTSTRQPAVCIIISVRSSNVTTARFPGTSKRVHLPRSLKCSFRSMWSGVLSYYSWIFRV